MDALKQLVSNGRRNVTKLSKGKVHKSVKANRKFSFPKKRHTIKYDKTLGKTIVKKKIPVKLEKQKVQKKVQKRIYYYEKDQYLAKIIMQFDQYTLLMNGVTEEYIHDLLEICLTYMDFYSDSNNNNKRIREEDESQGSQKSN